MNSNKHVGLRWAIGLHGAGVLLAGMTWLVMIFVMPRLHGPNAGFDPRVDTSTVATMMALVLLITGFVHMIVASVAWNERDPKVARGMLIAGAFNLVPTSALLAVFGVRAKRGGEGTV